jgi:hypothetical protein
MTLNVPFKSLIITTDTKLEQMKKRVAPARKPAPPPKPSYSATHQPVIASAPKAAVSVVSGERVLHKVFGEGKVLSSKAMGGDTLLEISFDKVGTKKVMANFAGLQKV